MGFRVVLREVMTPSAAMGLPPEHPTVQRGLIFALLPCLAIMMVPKDVSAKLLPAIAPDSDGLGMNSCAS